MKFYFNKPQQTQTQNKQTQKKNLAESDIENNFMNDNINHEFYMSHESITAKGQKAVDD